MDYTWLKRWMPRSLYARAALILLVPVLTVQIVVSVVFIQRHYEDVTRQMTHSVLHEVRFVLGEARSAADREAALRQIAPLASPLALDVDFAVAPPPADARLWYDISGRTVIETMRDELDGVASVDLARALRRVTIWAETPHGPLEVTFDRRRVSAANPHQLLVLMTFTSILMTIIAFLFLRNQLRPVKRLAEAAEAFGRGRTEPFRPAGATEMRVAGNAFLAMRNRIERMIDQRTLMLSSVSHDMRTPLTRLRLALSLAEENDDSRAMLGDVADMERLVDSFLEYARGDALDEREAVDLGTLVRGAAERARRAGQEASLGRIDDPGPVPASPVAISRALDNLLGNATRYGTRARLSLAAGDRSVRLTVEDDGPGIPADLRDEALKPFSRLDTARSQSRHPGVGLGLAIAGDVARRHGGALRLGESADLGGLRVDLILPA